jgi:nucleoside-diphosphate-sugar epimerase
MSGISQLPRHAETMEEVNIQGLKNVIEIAASIGVKAIVYTSTYNVVFGGEPIKDGDEDLEYFPLSRHVDNYSKTKSIAEQILLTADRKNGMRTCSLRLAGVMGPMEERHLPRIVDNIDKRRLVINYMDEGGAVVDFVGIQNVVQAHVRAALKLLDDPSEVGGAYFISDGVPINNMEYFRPLIKARGRSYPRLYIPMIVMFIIVCIIEFMANMLNISPLLTRAELFKTGVSHYFSIKKAQKDFSYRPTKPNDMSLITKYYSR